MKRVLRTCSAFALPIIFLFLLGWNADAATVTASSCSQSNVQTAVNNATAGDTVTVPSGNCTWADGVTISKGITVQGAGSSTIITGAGNSFFTINGNGSGNYRISNMVFLGTSSGGTDISINGSWDSMRIDHITWKTGSSRAIYLGRLMVGDIVYRGINHTYQKALIDNIDYTPAAADAGRPFILIFGLGYRAWQQDDGFGSDNFVFIEDCNFNYTSNNYVVDTEMGGRFVFRYNNVRNAGVSMHDFGGQLLSRGNRATEQYNNTLTCSGSGCGGRTGLQSTRGGTGLFYNNEIRGYGMPTWPMIFRVAYNTSFFGGGSCGQTGTRKVCQDLAKRCSISKKPCYSTSDCGKSGGTCPDSYDGLWCSSNSDCKDVKGNDGLCMQVDGLGRTGSEIAGWPCRDQTGRGKDDPSTGKQEVSPVYWWNNTVDGVSDKAMSVSGSYQYNEYIKLNRDYCNHSPETSCGSKAAWTYKPYTYPHPLQKGEIPPPPDTGDIKPPGNFRIAK